MEIETEIEWVQQLLSTVSMHLYTDMVEMF